ncbi:MAG: polyketide synthase dehydratase domain-containing protein, partial [Gammaproteobacteria bacterium]|nr:polyketide synthase dehydratase domain-containing protein [Gammaproteobacteria bacterium]MCW5583908.1 polyketide synthase dehydratase domain-containing protein [Gammaproteobacteria bacterium]
MRSKKRQLQDISTVKPSFTEIAIIGISCRFPGADNYNQFWDNLRKGINSIHEITPDRWDVSKYYSTDRNAFNKSVSKWGGLLNQIDTFDAPFFHISPLEAENMDPQQRLLLEETWHCIEDAGVSLSKLQKGNTSVYVGVASTDYYQYLVAPEIQINSYVCLGSYEGIVANRLSYFFNLTGESQSIDNACASSLVALHEARKNLLGGTSEYSIVAGVNIICHPWKYISFSKANMLSPDGQCKTFDSRADGYVPGEGVGVLLLEPLEKALEKQHHIYGILKSSSVHHSGKTKSLTVPKVEAQQRVIAEAILNCKISSESITYQEAHGTGTSLGDPIEIEALTRAFHTKQKQYCHIGSVKTNIGHLEGAAGVAGVIKVLLMMQHKKIPKTLNITTVNPIIDFENSPFCLSKELADWKLPKSIPVRRAGVSSFGAAGVNAYIILEEYFPQYLKKTRKKTELYLPFILSAKKEISLKKLSQEWMRYTQTETFQNQSLDDICYTLATGRELFNYKLGAIVRNKRDLVQFLEQTNQGSHDVYNKGTIFQEQSLILRLGPALGFSYSKFSDACQLYPVLKKLENECFKKISQLDKGKSLLKKFHSSETSFQLVKNFLALFIISKALFETGLQPRFLMGSNINNAVMSGMLDFNSAIQFLMGKKETLHLKRPRISFYDVKQKIFIEPYYIPAAYCHTLMRELEKNIDAKNNIFEKCRQLEINQYTFKKYILEWKEVLEKNGINIKNALHKPGILDNNQQILLLVLLLFCLKKLNQKWDLTEKIYINNPGILEIIDLMVDEVLTQGEIVELFLDSREITQEKIVAKIKEREYRINRNKPYILLKQFNKIIHEIPNANVWLEQSFQENSVVEEKLPQSIKYPLYVNIGSNAQSFNFKNSSFLDLVDILHALPTFLMDLWNKGIPIDWEKWYFSRGRKTVALPTYPFAKEKYWIETSVDTVSQPHFKTILHPLLQENKSNMSELKYTSIFTGEEFFLKDHVIQGIKILPGVAYLEMADQAIREVLDEFDASKQVIQFKNIVWTRPIIINEPTSVTISLYPEEKNIIFFEVTTEKENEIVVHSQGVAHLLNLSKMSHPINLTELQSHCHEEPRIISKIYDYFSARGLEKMYVNKERNVALVSLRLPDSIMNTFKDYQLHPSLLDAAIGVGIIFRSLQEENASFPILPFSLDKITILKPFSPKMWALVRRNADVSNAIQKLDIDLCDEAGEVCVKIRGFTARILGRVAITTNQTHIGALVM